MSPESEPQPKGVLDHINNATIEVMIGDLNVNSSMRVIATFVNGLIAEANEFGLTDALIETNSLLQLQVSKGIAEDNPLAWRLEGFEVLVGEAVRTAPRRLSENEYKVFKQIQDGLANGSLMTAEELGLFNPRDYLNDWAGIRVRTTGATDEDLRYYPELTPRGAKEILVYERNHPELTYDQNE